MLLPFQGIGENYFYLNEWLADGASLLDFETLGDYAHSPLSGNRLRVADVSVARAERCWIPRLAGIRGTGRRRSINTLTSREV
jgi:hypothetical protein